MFESEHKLRHLPFFEEIASLREGDAAWRAGTAGLVALRLVDAWLESAPLPFEDEFGTRNVRAAIDAMDDGTPIKSILSRVVDALHEQRPDIHVVVTPLMAYGRALEYDAKWPLAVDVYHSILSHLHPVEDADASISAHMRLGYCYQSMLQVDDASHAFSAASLIASSVGDLVGVVLARVNEGHIAVLRGNLPSAASILDDAIRRAVGPEFQEVRARALHERSTVAHYRGDYELAIRLAYRAFGESRDLVARDRVLSDLAGSFFELGVYSAARDAYLVLSATAQEQFTRWTATINLLEVASKSGAEVEFQLYRRMLVNEPLPPLLKTGFNLHVGRGYHRFGDVPNAKLFLERALTLASEHGLNQYVFEAEKALKALETPTPRLHTTERLSLDVEEVAFAIKELRETAGV